MCWLLEVFTPEKFPQKEIIHLGWRKMSGSANVAQKNPISKSTRTVDTSLD